MEKTKESLIKEEKKRVKVVCWRGLKFCFFNNKSFVTFSLLWLRTDEWSKVLLFFDFFQLKFLQFWLKLLLERDGPILRPLGSKKKKANNPTQNVFVFLFCHFTLTLNLVQRTKKREPKQNVKTPPVFWKTSPFVPLFKKQKVCWNDKPIFVCLLCLILSFFCLIPYVLAKGNSSLFFGLCFLWKSTHTHICTTFLFVPCVFCFHSFALFLRHSFCC